MPKSPLYVLDRSEKSYTTGRKTLASPQEAFRYMTGSVLSDFEPQEKFYCLYLDTQNGVIGTRLISIGSLNATLVHPIDVFRYAVGCEGCKRHPAASIMLLHIHPSGDPTPSAEDITFTHKIESAGQTMGVRLLDHIVIGDNCFTSMAEKGIL